MKIFCVQVVIQLLLALQTFGSPVDLLSQLPEDPIDPPNGIMLMITRINCQRAKFIGSGHNYEGCDDLNHANGIIRINKMIITQIGLGDYTLMVLVIRFFIVLHNDSFP